jgi:FtsZ-binding cell division protein ZapB
VSAGLPADAELVELVDSLRDEIDVLEAQLAALEAGEHGEALKAEIRKRFGIDRRLQQSMEQVKAMEATIRRHEKWQDKVRALVGARNRADVLDRIMALQARP